MGPQEWHEKNWAESPSYREAYQTAVKHRTEGGQLRPEAFLAGKFHPAMHRAATGLWTLRGGPEQDVKPSEGTGAHSMSDRPREGEDYAAYRARRKMEMEQEAQGVGAGPSADEQMEAKKAQVRAGNAAKASGPKAARAVNMDTAVEEADAAEKHAAIRRGGVKPLNMDAIAAADKALSKKGSDWGSKTPEEQQAIARSAPAHTTETPGPAPKPAVGAAMAKAQAKAPAAPAPAPRQAPPRQSSPSQPTVVPTFAGDFGAPKAPRGKDRAVDPNRQIPGQGELFGRQGYSGNPEQQTRARRYSTPSQTESAAAPTLMRGEQPLFNIVNTHQTAKAASSAPSAAATARSNMAAPPPHVPSSVVAGVTTTDSAETRQQARAAAKAGARGGGKAAEAAAARVSATRRSAASAAPVATPAPAPEKPVITPTGSGGFVATKESGPRPVPVANPAPVAPAPAANAIPSAPSAPTTQPTFKSTRDNTIGLKPAKGVSPSHMVSSAPDRDWLTPQAANKAKAAKAPREAVVEPSVETPAPPASQPQPVRPPAPSWDTEAPKTTFPAKTNLGAHTAPAATAAPTVGRAPAAPQRTPMAAQQMEHAVSEPVSAPAAPSGPQRRTASPVTTPPSPTGGGRGGGVNISSGDNSTNVGGNVYGGIQHHYNIAYGNVGGNLGGQSGSGVGAGYGGRPSGGGRAGGGHEEEGGEGRFNVWYKDAHGTHDLRKGVAHYTGQTGGHGESLKPKGKGSVVGRHGGAQRPIAGSPRASGSASPAPSATGSTQNWQSPGGGVQHPASGIGTAQHQPQPVKPPTTTKPQNAIP